MMHGREKSDLAIVAAKPANNDGRPSAELVERKGGGRGERGPGPHAPGSGPGKRVKGTGPHTARCTTDKEGTVHRAPPPCHPRPAPDGLLRPQATSCPRRGWA